MIDKEPASGDVVAVTDGEFVTLDERRFLSVSQQNPFFTIGILRTYFLSKIGASRTA